MQKHASIFETDALKMLESHYLSPYQLTSEKGENWSSQINPLLSYLTIKSHTKETLKFTIPCQEPFRQFFVLRRHQVSCPMYQLRLLSAYWVTGAELRAGDTKVSG